MSITINDHVMRLQQEGEGQYKIRDKVGIHWFPYAVLRENGFIGPALKKIEVKINGEIWKGGKMMRGEKPDIMLYKSAHYTIVFRFSPTEKTLVPRHLLLHTKTPK